MTDISKKICILLYDLESGGAERQAVNIAKVLNQANHRVSIVTYREGNFFENDLRNTSIDYRVLHCRNRLETIRKTRSELVHGHYDVVMAFLKMPMMSACIASLVEKKWRLILRLGTARKGIFRAGEGKLLAALAMRADAIVCNSVNERIMWLEESRVAPEKIHVIYNMHNILPNTLDIQGNNDGKIHIVVPASYSEVKNLNGLIRALEGLAPEERDQLDIQWFGRREVGQKNDTLYQQAKMQIETLGLTEVLHLNGECKTIHEEMVRADYVALFSIYEGLPNAICEALLLGRPVLMTRVSDYEILTNGNGINFESTADGIQEGLLQAIHTSDEDRKKMSQRSLEIASEYLAYDTLKDKWFSLL